MLTEEQDSVAGILIVSPLTVLFICIFMLSVVNRYSFMSKIKHDVLRAEYISMYNPCIVSDCAQGVPFKADGPGYLKIRSKPTEWSLTNSVGQQALEEKKNQTKIIENYYPESSG